MDHRRPSTPPSCGGTYAPASMSQDQLQPPAATNNPPKPQQMQPDAMDFEMATARNQRKLAKRIRDKKALNRPKYHPNQPCAQCHSCEHQLVGHPNPNTRQGYLKGCLPCNALDHSFAECKRFKPGQKWKEFYHYYIVKREGMCPGEFHGDIREIVNREGNYTLEHMPLTQGFALDNIYPDVEHFRAPGKDDDRTMLKSDPYWNSAIAWSNLGCWAEPDARVHPRERESWLAGEQERQEKIHRNLVKQYIDQRESAPPIVQLLNFSTIRSVQPPRLDAVSLWADGADVEKIWRNILYAECYPTGVVLEPTTGFPERTPTSQRMSRSVSPESWGAPPAPNGTDLAEYTPDRTASALGEKLVRVSESQRREMALAQNLSLEAYIKEPAGLGWEVARHAENIDPTPPRDPADPTASHRPRTRHHIQGDSIERANSPTPDRLLSLMNLGTAEWLERVDSESAEAAEQLSSQQQRHDLPRQAWDIGPAGVRRVAGLSGLTDREVEQRVSILAELESQQSEHAIHQEADAESLRDFRRLAYSDTRNNVQTPTGSLIGWGEEYTERVGNNIRLNSPVDQSNDENQSSERYAEQKQPLRRNAKDVRSTNSAAYEELKKRKMAKARITMDDSD
ncbi:hypothetical protein BDZ45DRAFT_751982 [Acephala macrosclerotiorum]|nr:hypothetical protein BDZ45DRAFT_751982 [Acephala macrosclerotiorum]